MNQPQHSSPWRRWIALSGLLSLLLLFVVSAAHIHTATPNGVVRNECQLCVTGVSQALPVDAPLLAASAFVFFVFLVPVVLPHLTRGHQPGNPRSPPLSSIFRGL